MKKPVSELTGLVVQNDPMRIKGRSQEDSHSDRPAAPRFRWVHQLIFHVS